MAEPIPATSVAEKNPVVATAIGYVAPDGWTEIAASGLRKAQFEVADATCTITSFPGDVGGHVANIGRWLKQLNVDPPPSDQLQKFIEAMPAFETTSGFKGRVADLSHFVGADPKDESILAGIIQRGGETVFVKLSGPRSTLDQERAAFDGLCQSVK